jgi:hypothetical protein
MIAMADDVEYIRVRKRDGKVSKVEMQKAFVKLATLEAVRQAGPNMRDPKKRRR